MQIIFFLILFWSCFFFSLDDSSGWATLLIALMLEFNDENSYWAPYLRLVPQPEEFGHPLFWTANEHKEELKGTLQRNQIKFVIRNIILKCSKYPCKFFDCWHHSQSIERNLCF